MPPSVYAANTVGSQQNPTIPVSASTNLDDLLTVSVLCTGASVDSVSDSNGNNYSQVVFNSNTWVYSANCDFPLDTSDTVTAHLSGNSPTAIIGVAISNVTTLDLSVPANGTSALPQASGTPSFPNETALGVFGWNNGGGVGSSPTFILLNQKHAISQPFLTVGYYENPTQGQVLTASYSIVSTAWAASLLSWRIAASAIALSESGSGSDAIGVPGFRETGSGTDALAVPCFIEPGSGSDVLSINGTMNKAFTESGAGSDGLLIGGTWTVSLTESGAATPEIFSLNYTVSLTESGAGSDSIITVPIAGASCEIRKPQANPGASSVALSPPGSSILRWPAAIGQVTALTYSFVYPGGSDKMSMTVMTPASYRNQMFFPGWTARVFRGGHQVWSGKLEEPQYSAGQGWGITAVGSGSLGANFLAIYATAWPGGQPDEIINNAIARGLPWSNPGVGTPAGASYEQAIDSGSQTVSDALGAILSRSAWMWYVDPQPGGLITGNNLKVVALPTTPNRLLIVTNPVGRTLGGDYNVLYIRYQSSADNSESGTSATYGLTSVQNARSVADYGPNEIFLDVADAGVMTAGSAQAMGNKILSLYQRATFTGPFPAQFGDLMNMGGQPIDPGTDQAGTMVRLLVTDLGYGGDVVPELPVQFVAGQYEWDDFAQVATITPYQVLSSSISGLTDMEKTVMAPIAVSGG